MNLVRFAVQEEVHLPVGVPAVRTLAPSRPAVPLTANKLCHGFLPQRVKNGARNVILRVVAVCRRERSTGEKRRKETLETTFHIPILVDSTSV